VGLLRIFIGYKLLHEIWVRVEAGVNGLPGWAPKEEQLALFESISEYHWAPFSLVIDTAIIPLISMWVVIFGLVQFLVGVALLVGYRTRLAASVGLVYVGLLSVVGFTRYAPFVLGLLVAVLALDGGRALGFDSKAASAREPRYGLPIAKSAVPVLVVIAAVNAVAAAIAVIAAGGIIPDGYNEGVGSDDGRHGRDLLRLVRPRRLAPDGVRRPGGHHARRRPARQSEIAKDLSSA
jgi:hypothetical protein